MLAVVATLPAFMLPSTPAIITPRVASVQALAQASHPGSLPEMYRARWHHEERSEELPAQTSTPKPAQTSAPDTTNQVYTIAGACGGVALVSLLGVYKSVALAPLTIKCLHEAWSYGGAYDISRYTDMLTDGVASINALSGGAAVNLAIAVDFVAVASFTVLLLSLVAGSAKEQTASDAVCLLTAEDEPVEYQIVCGAASFDSTGSFACVEQWVDGKLRWVCA